MAPLEEEQKEEADEEEDFDEHICHSATQLGRHPSHDMDGQCFLQIAEVTRQ